MNTLKMRISERLYINKLDPRVHAALVTVIANGFTNAIKLIITLISIPLIIGYLGSSMYGLITTILTMCIWLNTIADGGIGLSLKNAIIQQRSLSNDHQKIAELASSAFFFLLFLILIICSILTCIIPFLNWNSILNIQIKLPYYQLILFIITILWSTLLIIPFTLPKLIYSAYQKEYLFSPWLIFGNLFGICLLLFVIKNNWGLIWTGSALQLGGLLGGILGTLWFTYRKNASYFTYSLIKWKTFSSLLSPSADFLFLQFTALAIFQSGIFITNYMLGQQQAAVYAIHFQIFAYYQMFATLIISPFWSVLSEIYHQRNKKLFQQILFYLTLGIGLISVFFSIGMGIFGNNIISLLSHHQIKYTPSLFWLLAIYHIASISIGTITLALLSIGDTRSMRKIVMMQGILNIIFSIFFVKLYGLIGCALGSLLSLTCSILWYSPLRIHHILKKW